MNGHWHAADLGPVQAWLVTGHADLAEYLAGFFPLTPCSEDDAGGGWAVDARLAVPEQGMRLTERGSGCRADAASRRAVVCAASPGDLGATVRGLLSEVLVGYLEAQGCTVLRASAVTGDGRAVIVAGGPGCGKTALALSAALARGYQLVADGHLVLFRGAGGPAMMSLPLPAQVPAGTWAHYAGLLGPPWMGDPAAAEAARELPAPGRYASPVRLWYTLRSLGQPGPGPVLLDGLDVTVVLAGYAGEGEPTGDPEPAAGHTAELWPHVRFDWAFNPGSNTRYLPRPACSRTAFTLATAARLTDLGGACRVVRWRHRGHMAPLLSHPILAPRKDDR